MAEKILVVDDDEGMLHILTIILQRAGYEIITADNGIDALDIVQRCGPALVILDDMMPGLTGGQVCMQIKADAALRSTPVVMHSAGMQILSDSYIRRIGAQAALSKPCPPRKMLDTIAQFLTQRSNSPG